MKVVSARFARSGISSHKRFSFFLLLLLYSWSDCLFFFSFLFFFPLCVGFIVLYREIISVGSTCGH